MSDWPTSVRYTERLSPDAQPMDVQIAASRREAFDMVAECHDLAAKGDADAWQARVRQLTACDWYCLGLFMSGLQRLDPFTGRPECDCDFQFNYAREMQFDSENVLDKSAREHFKTTWRCYVGATCVVLNDPNEVIALAAHEKSFAQRSGVRTVTEWLNNVELNAAWPDVFFGPDKTAWPLFSQENGVTVNRYLPAVLPTISWHSILLVPTGARVGLFIFDDVESETTVESSDMREKTLQRFTSFLQTSGRVPRVWLNGTHHHTQGLLSHLAKSGAFRVRCHPIEDTTRPAPDIAALFDACGGVLPLREELGRHEVLPPAVRDIRLDGEPVFLHPLEVAHKRLKAMATPGGLANYYMQNFGNALAGVEYRLDEEWIRHYSAPANEQARGAYIYILIDPSKGQGDPTFARVEACKSDGTISWVGGLRKKIPPSEFAPEIHKLYTQWKYVGRVVQVRIEEFGQSTWTHHLRVYFESINEPLPTLISCSRHTQSNKESEGRRREWAGLEPLYRMGRRLFPKDGIWVFDENGRRFDLVEHYVTNEYANFPMPVGGDDGLAADYLLAVDRGKNLLNKDVPLRLEFPDDEELEEQRLVERLMRRSRRHEIEHEDAWMEAGF